MNMMVRGATPQLSSQDNKGNANAKALQLAYAGLSQRVRKKGNSYTFTMYIENGEVVGHKTSKGGNTVNLDEYEEDTSDAFCKNILSKITAQFLFTTKSAACFLKLSREQSTHARTSMLVVPVKHSVQIHNLSYSEFHALINQAICAGQLIGGRKFTIFIRNGNPQHVRHIHLHIVVEHTHQLKKPFIDAIIHKRCDELPPDDHAAVHIAPEVLTLKLWPNTQSMDDNTYKAHVNEQFAHALRRAEEPPISQQQRTKSDEPRSIEITNALPPIKKNLWKPRLGALGMALSVAAGIYMWKSHAAPRYLAIPATTLLASVVAYKTQANRHKI